MTMTMRMQPLRRHDGKARPFRGMAFIAALWMTLLTALLSSMPSGGMIGSKLLGSAFDPATTSVVLRARSQANLVLKAAEQPPTPAAGPAPALAAVLSLVVALAALLLIRPTSAHRPAFAILHNHPCRKGARPRAPPLP